MRRQAGIETDIAELPAGAKSSLVGSPDARHVAYVEKVAAGQRVVVDRQPGKIYSKIVEGFLTFSPNSQRTAYLAETGQAKVGVIDSSESHPYQRTGPVVFSPDSRRTAF